MVGSVKLMAVPRHFAVPAASADEVLLAGSLADAPTYDGGVLLATNLGVAYLPVPWDLQTFAGVAVGGIAGALGDVVGGVTGKVVEETGKTLFAEPLVRDRVVPDRIRASLRRKGSFVAGHGQIVSVEYNYSSWFSGRGVVLGIATEATTKSYKVNFADEVENDHITTIAETIAQNRAITELCWFCLDAIASLDTKAGRPVATPPRLPLLGSIDSAFGQLISEAAERGLSRTAIAKRIWELHPEFREFEKWPNLGVFHQYWKYLFGE